MFIKLLIIIAILVGGGIVFANEINQFLPVTSANLFDPAENLGEIKDEDIQTKDIKVEGTLITANTVINNFKDSSTELLSKNVNDVTESTQNSLKEISKTTNENIKKITESTQKTIFGDNKNNQKQTNNRPEEDDNGNTTTKIDNENITPKIVNDNTISFETLSLTTIQREDNSVMLQYKDTSGKTISVSVILRTTERELFSGIFHSSMFETFVNDASNNPYFIDMTIEHKEYGIISSSVYNPGNSSNTIINGVFVKS